MKLRIFGPKEKVVKGMEETHCRLDEVHLCGSAVKEHHSCHACFVARGWRRCLQISMERKSPRGLILIGVPAVLAAAFTHPLARLLQGTMTVNRSALLAFVGAVIISVFCVVGALISFAIGWQLTISAYVMSLGVVFAFRMLVLMAITQKSFVRNLVPASLQTVFGALFLLLFGVTGYVVNLVAISVVFALGALVVIRYVDAAVEKVF